MTLNSFVKWNSLRNPFNKCLERSLWTCSKISLRKRLFKDLKHTRRLSSHIVTSPFLPAEIPDILIPDLLSHIADRFPEATALKCALTGRSYTYGELQVLSLRFSNSLVKAGFLAGEVMAVVLPNCPEFAIVTIGALSADMTVTLMNHSYTPGEMYHQLKDSGSVCVVTGVERLPDLQVSITKMERTSGTNPVRKVIAMDIPSPGSLPEGVARFSEAIADHVDHSRRTSRSTTKDLAILPYSSGTTGLPKGVCLSHCNIVSCLYQVSFSGLGCRGPDNGQEIVLGLLPFFHIYGFIVMKITLMHGGQIITLPGFRPEYLIQTLEKEKISKLFLVPPIISFLGLHPVIDGTKHLAHVRLVVTGTDIIEANPLEKLKTKLPTDCQLCQGYGMTETSGFATFPTLPAKNLTTCGAPGALTEARAVDIDTGEALGPNRTGELCFRGPQIMLGYNNNPKATTEVKDEEGWLRTGDIGYYDTDNHFYVEGRLKELIKVKGFQVPPAELEVVLRALPGVSDAAVIGVPNPDTGETPVAYVVRTRGSTLTEGQVIAYLARKVARHKQVSRVFFVNQIPKSPSGKILRKELQEWFQDERY